MNERNRAELPAIAILNEAAKRALAAAKTGPIAGANPRVGCAIIAGSGESAKILSIGKHRGAGSDHAEVDALNQLATASPGSNLTALVTLEPCNHYGRTPPCVLALAKAKIASVIYLQSDLNPIASGGGNALSELGVNVYRGEAAGIDPGLIKAAATLNWRLNLANSRQRPWVCAKIATSLDGYIAGQDGASKWITGEKMRAYARQRRADFDAIIIGTATALADNPRLDAGDQVRSPLPVVIGNRDLDASSHLANNPRLIHLRTHDLAAALGELYQRGVRMALIEGGAQLVSAALAAGLVDAIAHYQAPLLLGGGTRAIGPLPIAGLSQAPRGRLSEYRAIGDDVYLEIELTTENEGTCLQD